jgi:hypothetical protein
MTSSREVDEWSVDEIYPSRGGDLAEQLMRSSRVVDEI